MEILNEGKQHSWLLGNFRSCDVAPWSLRVGHVTCHVTLVTTGSLRNVARGHTTRSVVLSTSVTASNTVLYKYAI